MNLYVSTEKMFLPQLRYWKVYQNAWKYEARKFFNLSEFYFTSSFCLINNETASLYILVVESQQDCVAKEHTKKYQTQNISAVKTFHMRTSNSKQQKISGWGVT